MLRFPSKGKDVIRTQQTNLVGPILSQLLVFRKLGEGKLLLKDDVNTKNIHLAHFGTTGIRIMTAQSGGPWMTTLLKSFYRGRTSVFNPVSVLQASMFESEKLYDQAKAVRKEELQKACDQEKQYSNLKVLGVALERSDFMTNGSITRFAAFEDDKGVYLVTLGTQSPNDVWFSTDKITKVEDGWLRAQIASSSDLSVSGSSEGVSGWVRSPIIEEITRPARMEELVALYQLAKDRAQKTGKPLILHGHSLGGAFNYGLLAMIMSLGLEKPDAVVQYGGLPVIDKDFGMEILKRKIACVSFMHELDPVPWFTTAHDILSSLRVLYGTKKLGVLFNAPHIVQSTMLAQRQARRQCMIGELYVLGIGSSPSGISGAAEHAAAEYERHLGTAEVRDQNCKRMVIVDSTPEGEQQINPLTAEGLTSEQLDGIIDKKKTKS